VSAGATMNTPPRKPSLLRTARAVGWSFIGIRKGSESREDMGRLNPFHVIAVALVGVALFVGGLVVLVHWVVK
jgi:hypothetical protein